MVTCSPSARLCFEKAENRTDFLAFLKTSRSADEVKMWQDMLERINFRLENDKVLSSEEYGVFCAVRHDYLIGLTPLRGDLYASVEKHCARVLALRSAEQVYGTV